LTLLPALYFGFLLMATLTYLLLVDVAKRQLVRYSMRLTGMPA
jgi:hypothetical protein